MGKYENGIGYVFKASEVAKMLGCDRSQISRWRRALGIEAPHARKVGNKYVFTQAAVARMSYEKGRNIKGLRDVC